jgi:putative ABC transport system permease protein
LIRNYLKIAWRNLLKNKAFSFINIFGLAVGLTCFILISLYITDELSYDKFYPNAERIYRINSDISFGGTDMHMAQSADPFGPTIKKDYQEVEQFTRLYANSGSRMIKKGAEFINEAGFTYADSTFFDVFALPILEGNPKTALNAPNTIAISKTAAIKYFGNSTLAIGKTLEIQDEKVETFNVTAVYDDIPTNAHFHFDFICSMKNVKYDFGQFLSHNFHTYIRLAKGVDYQVFEKKFDDVIMKYIFPQAQQYMQIKSMDDFKKAGNSLNYSLIPLTDIHLKSDRSSELSANSSMQYIYIFGAVALFLLLIACINFMNLSTARSANRAKEVGIRKVMGTQRQTLIGQFISESALTSYIAFGFALILVAVLLPFFNDLAAKSFTFSMLLKPQILPFLILLPFVVGILAGYYPAFFLSSFQPIEVLKGKLNVGSSKSNLRNGLVIFQFTISLILIISTVIVYRQLNYIQTKNLGFNKDQMLVLNGTYFLKNNNDAFKNEVLGMAGVKGGSYADYLPVENSSRSDNTFSKDPIMSNTNSLNMQIWRVDYDYIPNLGMEMAMGRNFSRQFGSDSSGIILNEAAVKQFGFTDPLGKNIYSSGAEDAYKIVGVVKDFHFSSLRQNVGPLAMRLGKKGYTMAFKINAENTSQLISQIEARWKVLAPSMPFSYEFLDESFDKMYRAEQRIGKVAMAFALLTILIACLGLFGLVTYITEQRIKEIGIRKVLGASLPSIVGLLSKDFLKLVSFAIIIACPIAYYFMDNWLSDFAFRTNIDWWIFALAGISTLLIALFTVSYQVIKAALMNPVKSLKTE